MLDQIDVIGSDREKAALAFGDAVAAIIIDVNIKALCLKELELRHDLIGKHRVCEGAEHVTARLTGRICIRLKLVAAQLAAVPCRERHALDAWNRCNTAFVWPACDRVVKS